MSWHNPRTNPAPLLEEVLLALHSEPGEATVGVRLPNGFYRLMEDHVAADSDVYAWTELPKPPAAAYLGINPNTPGDEAINS